jgi:hypothetical protein
MQHLPIYLYDNSLDVILDLDPTTAGVHNVMYQRDIKIQKGIKNNIRVQFKNSDQKRIPISNTGTYVFSMFDAVNNRMLLQKNLQVLDDGVTVGLRGLAQLNLLESDTMDLEVSEYQFSIKYQDPMDGTYLPAYSNTYYSMAGQIQLLQDVFPTLQPSQEITVFNKVYNDDIRLYQWFSGNTYAYPEYNSNTALHTMALYMTNYIGSVTIQGTLYNTPAAFGRYVNISTLNYTGFSGVDYLNFNGIFSFVRVVYQPALGPTDYNNDNTSYSGTFDKVLYRS